MSLHAAFEAIYGPQHWDQPRTLPEADEPDRDDWVSERDERLLQERADNWNEREWRG